MIYINTNIIENAIWKPDDRLCFIYSIKNTFDKENRERIEDYLLKYNEKVIKFITPFHISNAEFFINNNNKIDLILLSLLYFIH